MAKTSTKQSAARLMIIDGNALVHRCFHAIPPLATKDGVLVNAVYGFITTLLKAIKDLKPTHIAVTFDVAGGTFRNEVSDIYKATRVKAPDELYAQIPLIKEVLAAMDIPVFEKKGFEADDVIGTITKLVDGAVEKIVVTGDMDTLQLVDAFTKVYTMRKGLSDTVLYDVAAVEKRYGFAPVHTIDYKALRGDVSDNIKGVKGIGEKTGMDLVQRYGSIENLYEKLELAEAHGRVLEGVSARIQKLLLENKSAAVQSKVLATIVRDVPLDFSLDACAFSGIERDKIFPVLQKFEFLSLLSRLPGATEEPLVEKKVRAPKADMSIARDAAATRSLVAKLVEESEVAIYFTRVQQQDLFSGSVALMGFAWDDQVAAIELREEKQWDELGKLFMNRALMLVGHDLKQLMHELAAHGLRVACQLFDVMVAAYLLQAGTRAHDLPNLAITILGEDVPVTEWTSADPAVAAVVAGRIWRIAEIVREQLDEKNQTKLFREIEMPLIAPLARMERYGILVDADYLAKLHKSLTKKLEKISEKIYAFAGHEFNIASPQQVSEVLFEELKLSTFGIKRGKTGISTAAGELEKLKGTHEIIDSILDHREIAKLLSTYVDALPKLLGADGRVHTSYNQALTATGRLSSSNPNLQNIPVRTELGRDIRRAFVAAQGYTLISCDYSQIELRIVAHLAQDKKLIEIFERGEDVHKATAAEIHGVPLADVTKEQRFSAKEVNFGVLYGMGAWGLAERTGISQQEARAFIEKYFATFTGVAQYLERVKIEARERGYAETMFGRRRYVPELASGVAAVRASGERMAVNMPIQGTQADIVKKAMLAVDEFLRQEYGFGFAITPEERACPARMLLQVHDELIFEVKDALAKELAPRFVEIMNGVAKLLVPLKVDFAIGKSWADLD